MRRGVTEAAAAPSPGRDVSRKLPARASRRHARRRCYRRQTGRRLRPIPQRCVAATTGWPAPTPSRRASSTVSSVPIRSPEVCRAGGGPALLSSRSHVSRICEGCGGRFSSISDPAACIGEARLWVLWLPSPLPPLFQTRRSCYPADLSLPEACPPRHCWPCRCDMKWPPRFPAEHLTEHSPRRLTQSRRYRSLSRSEASSAWTLATCGLFWTTAGGPSLEKDRLPDQTGQGSRQSRR